MKVRAFSKQVRELESEVSRMAPPASKASRAKAEKARADFDAFVEYCFVDSVTGDPIRQGDIHRQWTEHCNKHRRAGIEAPREHGKSEQRAIFNPIWKLGNNPQQRLKILCQDDGNARKRLTSIKGHIERNPRVHEVFPKLRPHPTVDDWTKHTITVARTGEDKDPSIEALGILSSGTGSRCDGMIFDDVVDFRNAIAMPALRDQVKEAVDNVWINLLTENAWVEWIDTPWHEDDASAYMKTKKNWHWIRQPIPQTMEPIWPERWTVERLLARRVEINLRAFARGFHLVPLADEDLLFGSIDRCMRPDLYLEDVNPEWPRYMGVDLGHAKRKHSGGKAKIWKKDKPYTVLFTLAVDENGRRWPIDIRRGHWSGPETAQEICECFEWHQHLLVGVENNAYQQTLIEWLQLVSSDLNIPIVPFTTGTNKADELIGLPSLAAEFDNGNWIIATDGMEPDELEGPWAAWYAEMKYYPGAPLSDTVMACWFAREMARKRGAKAAMVASEDVEAAEPVAAGGKKAPPVMPECGWRDYLGRKARA